MTFVPASYNRILHDKYSVMTDLDEELVRHNRAAFVWALACCRWDRSLAEDVVQIAYLKLIDGRARFAGSSSNGSTMNGDFRGFLFGVIRRTALEERRRRAIRSALSLGFAHRAADHVEPEGLDPLIRDETSRELIRALDTLSDRQREVLTLVFYHDLTIAAAAGVLGISLGSARIHYERGKANLRQLLGDE
jgi:RNA polymerase sigma factor (sigma-70 family)